MWWQFAQQAAQRGFVQRNGTVAENLLDIIQEHLVNVMMRDMVMRTRAVAGDEGIFGQAMAKFMMQRHWVPLVAQYELNGRQIFDLDDEVMHLLAKTDVSDCTLEDWNPPYDAFFLRIGKQENTSLVFGPDETEHLDGAFVAVTPWDDTGARRIKFGLCTVKGDGRGVMMPGYFLDFIPAETRMAIKAAIEAALARKIAEIQDGPGNTKSELVLNEIRRDEYREGAELMRQGIALIVNSLFYIESLGERSTSRSPGRDVPPDLHAQWAQKSPKGRQQEAQKILDNGYAMVHMTGSESVKHQSTGDRGDAATHWRRGHWRMQPHGEGRQLVKRVWIRPVMVNPEKPHEDLTGRIYAVREGGGSATH
jgi:hypothetical protein